MSRKFLLQFFVFHHRYHDFKTIFIMSFCIIYLALLTWTSCYNAAMTWFHDILKMIKLDVIVFLSIIKSKYRKSQKWPHMFSLNFDINTGHFDLEIINLVWNSSSNNIILSLESFRTEVKGKSYIIYNCFAMLRSAFPVFHADSKLLHRNIGSCATRSCLLDLCCSLFYQG